MSKKDIFTKKNIIQNGKYAIFYGDISRKYDCFAQEIINRIDDESYEKATKVEKEQILVNLEDFDDKDIGRCVLYQNEKSAAVNGNIAILILKDSFKDIIDLRYISFYLNYKDTVRDYIYKKSTGEKVKRLAKLDFENMLITIPTLEVQNKITDNFIALKRKFENDITELEEKIKIIDENSKVYMDHIFKFN
ncbi:restriction endonuclease subunit S [Fusobacterium massiliense]|uniref:restriction endonuclease subunit S n=1 Tax=Fusobacterium massiliense TaxID=1852365 RepID=UPI000A9E76E2|nr:restriction endonuclease subunit S [Fusobacterium massiliense]